MYAVIESGGKQYRVELDTELALDRLDVEPGQTIEFERVLLVADPDGAAVGRPHVAGARVSASVLRQDRGDKIVVFKYRPKARSRVKQGHRADLTVVRISDIVHGDTSARKQAEAARTERERLAAAAAENAARQAEADKALAAKLAGDAEAVEAPANAKAPRARTTSKPKGDAKAASKPEAKAPKSTSSRTQAPPPAAKPKRAPKKDE